MKPLSLLFLICLGAAGYSWYEYVSKPVQVVQPAKKGLTLLEIGFIPCLPAKEHTDLKVSHTTASGTSEVAVSQEKRPLAIHFWAPWCSPCRGELPHFAKFAADHPQARVWCVADVDQTPQSIQSYYSEKKLVGLPIMIDTQSKLSKHLKVDGLPTTVFFDKDGRERGRIVGQVPWHDAEAAEIIMKELLS